MFTGCDDACKLLIKAKADVAATDKDGLTGKRSFDPVHTAQPNNPAAVLQIFVVSYPQGFNVEHNNQPIFVGSTWCEYCSRQ